MCPRYCFLLGINELYFKTGVKQKRFIPMHKVAEQIGHEMSLILPVIHALSGCDSTSSFTGIGKLRWFKTVQSHPELVAGLKKVGKHPSKDQIDTEALDSCTKLVCLLYSSSQDNSDELRYKLFAKKKPVSDKLPPTADAFLQHMSQVNYQVLIWLHADEQFLCLPSPENNGWKFNKNCNLVPVTMTKPAAPEALLTFLECKCKCSCNTRRCI